MSESACSSSSAETSSRPPWRRILYEQQPYPDNYTPPDFLAGYLPSSHGTSAASPSAPTLSYWTLLFLSLIIMSRLSLLLLFLSLFYAMSTAVLSSTSLLSINVGIIALLLSIHLLLTPRTQPDCSISASLPAPQSSSSSSSFGSLCLLFFLLYLASPLLSSLTLAYSDDTIYMLTALLSILHLLTFDYGHINYPTATQPATVSSSSSSAASEATRLPLASLEHTVSLNCALFLSILLASRVTSHQQTFLLLLSSSLLFAVSPAQQQLLRHRSPVLHLLSSLSLMLCCSLVFLSLRLVVVLVSYLLCCCFVVLLCPACMLWLQRDKQEIRGPWDYDDEPENRSENL